MRLHRNTPKVLRFHLGMLCWGGLCVFAGWLAEVTDRGWPPFYYLGGIGLLIWAVCGLVALSWTFHVDVDSSGLTVRCLGATTRLPWAAVEAVTVRKAGDSWSSPVLEIRLAPGFKLRRRWGAERAGRRTYQLLSLDDFTLPPEEVIAVLRRHGGDGRVDADEYLWHRDGRRRLARFLAEQAVAEPERPRPRRRPVTWAVLALLVGGLVAADGPYRDRPPAATSAGSDVGVAGDAPTPAGVASPVVGPSAPSVTPSRPVRVAAVVYEVIGQGRAYIIYRDPAQPSSVVLPAQRLPWRVALPRQPVDFVLVSASRDEHWSGPRTVRILVDGVEVCAKSDEGAYRSANCDALIPAG
ncbi:PH domain-containing protein [Micromonospora sp. DR5-3]|uniref:PH domain-containing protein n=1 Tax=unclassified Micromonospora TaxID=2617518 RepID=UPI0011DAC391|nr:MULTISPECIES: PH domain-containing protein [unclassified Micromonospora]MCW3816312.1 PH domain-containing protein [Micromonospora sp. DR5-3]TYC23892.1 hypothetical protein FXF52_12635 [Micromonospora sp. MP36]